MYGSSSTSRTEKAVVVTNGSLRAPRSGVRAVKEVATVGCKTVFLCVIAHVFAEAKHRVRLFDSTFLPAILPRASDRREDFNNKA
jgi:hypothetical protein